MEYMLQLVTSQRFNAPESDTSKQHTTEHNDSSRGLRLDGLTGITSTAPFRGFLLRTVPVTLGVEVLLMLGIGCWYFAGERIWRRQSLSIGVNSSRETKPRADKQTASGGLLVQDVFAMLVYRCIRICVSDCIPLWQRTVPLVKAPALTAIEEYNKPYQDGDVPIQEHRSYALRRQCTTRYLLVCL